MVVCLQHWQCKLFMATFHLVISVNYMWIFIEALYLHMLIFVSVFSENSSICWYLAFGWRKSQCLGIYCRTTCIAIL